MTLYFQLNGNTAKLINTNTDTKDGKKERQNLFDECLEHSHAERSVLEYMSSESEKS